MKVAVITCYKDKVYVRSATLRAAVAAQDNTEMLVCSNNHAGLLRYPEVLAKLIWLRLTKRPDVYLITFRGYEILPFVALLSWPKTLIYDEFINPLEWLEEERPEWWAKLVPKKLLKQFYKLLLKRCTYVLADTKAHADYSAKLLGMPSAKFKALPVGADETVFRVLPDTKNMDEPAREFTVFYYGSMLGLHGIDVVLEAALMLSPKPIKFVIAGGGKPTEDLVASYNARGAKIKHLNWIEYSKLPLQITASNLTIGGPFGNSPQARRVITGKTYQFLACKAPVLIGQNQASKDIFIDEVNCLSVPLGNAQALADKIAWAQEHPKQLESIAEAGHKLYNQEFSSAALAVKTAKLLSTSN